jgi:hypothetical protein
MKRSASRGKMPRPRDGVVSHKTTGEIIWSKGNMFPVTCKMKSVRRWWSGLIWLRTGAIGVIF